MSTPTTEDNFEVFVVIRNEYSDKEVIQRQISLELTDSSDIYSEFDFDTAYKLLNDICGRTYYFETMRGG